MFFQKKRQITLVLLILVLISVVFIPKLAGFVQAQEQKLGIVNENADIGLNVRTGAGTSYDKLQCNGENVKLSMGTEVMILNEVTIDNAYNPRWYEIEFTYKNKTLQGFVSASYITITQMPDSDDTKDTTEESEDVKLSDEEFEKMLEEEGFPASYKVYLRELHEQHPNWKFKALQTGLSWNVVVENEKSKQGRIRNTISCIRPISYRSTEALYDWATDTYYPYDGAGNNSWYAVSDEVLKYYLDPRNFFNETQIFQFESLAYSEDTQTKEGVEAILSGSFMSNTEIIYNGQTYLYSDAFIAAAEYSKVSPYHLASRVRQEVGASGSGSTSGTNSTYPGIYNFYNIGANDSATGGAILNGLKWASNASGKASEYLLPWTSQYISIKGGSYFLGKNYINKGQYTLYLEKFDVEPTNGLYAHQYMTNVEAPKSEATKMFSAYENYDMLDTPMTFVIPVYLNMPDKVCELPESTGSPNNWLKSLSVSNSALTPTFSANEVNEYDSIVEYDVKSVEISASAVNSNAKVEISGVQSGKSSVVQKVDLVVGMNRIPIRVTAQNGDIREYVITVVRKEVENISELFGDDFHFEQQDKIISGVSPDITVGEFIVKLGMSEEYQPKVYRDNQEKKSTDKVATADQLKVEVSGEEITYQIVVYGDVNGDGSINAIDLLAVRKEIISPGGLTGLYKKAANVDKNVAGINAVDLLMIRKHILKEYTIEQ